jgi:hypothetical protein
MPSPLPKHPSQRQRRNRRSTIATLPVTSSAAFVPLPARTPPWKPATMAWWGLIWASPMATEWVDADVPGLIKLAGLEERFWVADAKGDTAEMVKASAEARYLMREYGLTPMARRALQWEIKRLEAVKPTTFETPDGSARGSFSVLTRKAG